MTSISAFWCNNCAHKMFLMRKQPTDAGQKLPIEQTRQLEWTSRFLSQKQSWQIKWTNMSTSTISGPVSPNPAKPSKNSNLLPNVPPVGGRENLLSPRKSSRFPNWTHAWSKLSDQSNQIKSNDIYLNHISVTCWVPHMASRWAGPMSWFDAKS